MADSEPDLDAAYALETPDDNRALYATWAQTYEDGFARQMDYRLPQIVAETLAEVLSTGPILDVGAGTGLVADFLPTTLQADMDALDISPEMLKVAAGKGRYRHLIEADLTQGLDIADGTYGAVVSAGTFTHGHVGPECLDELVRIAAAGAVFVLSINAEHFDARGFAARFEALAPLLTAVQHRTVRIYGQGGDDPHREDHAVISIFSKR